MTAYLCLVTTRPGQVPQLRHIDCDHDDAVEAALPAVLAEWPAVHQVEVLDGDRPVRVFKGQALAAARGCQTAE